VIGGKGAGGGVLNDFWKLDTVTNQWLQLALFPSGIANMTAVYVDSYIDDGVIYVPGGDIDGNGNYSRTHWRYSNGLWEEAPVLVGGSYVTTPFGYAAAVANDLPASYFLTGGVVGQGYPLTTTATALDQVLLYRPDISAWSSQAHMSSPRYGHVAAKVGNRICVAGGINIDHGSNQIVLVGNGECATISTGDLTSWSSIGSMSVPRYFANSSVGPDGKWYIYGGVDATGLAVPEVEVYDPATNQWSLLDLRYDLEESNRAVVWPRGGFVGHELWSIGGSFDSLGNEPNPFVKKLQVLPRNTYLPVILKGVGFGANHTFASAWPLPLNSTLSQSITSQQKFANVYYFDLNQTKSIQVALTGVDMNTDLNLYVYDAAKVLRGKSDSPFLSGDEIIPGPYSSPAAPTPFILPAGRYYVVVYFNYSTNFDADDLYQIRVSG
jgi:hypothetical protein